MARRVKRMALQGGDLIRPSRAIETNGIPPGSIREANILDTLDGVPIDKRRKKIERDVPSIEEKNEIAEKFLAVAKKLGAEPQELLDLLADEKLGVSVRMGLDRALRIEARTPTGRRAPRHRQNLAAPDKSGSHELNRQDHRLAAMLPSSLVYEFGKRVMAVRGASQKDAFTLAAQRWIEGSALGTCSEDAAWAGEKVQYQVRLDDDVFRAFEATAAQRGMRRRFAVAEAMQLFLSERLDRQL